MTFPQWLRRRYGKQRPASEWRKGYENDGLVSATLSPGQVILPPGTGQLPDEPGRDRPSG